MKKLLLLLCVLICTACGTTPPDRQDFLLSAQRAGASLPARFGALQVNELRSSAPFRDLALVYRESAQRYIADPYHGFLATPSSQITQHTRRWLSQSGLFSQVYPSGSSLIAPWQLEGEVLAIYIDVSEPKSPKAVIHAQFLLSHQQQSRSFDLSAVQALPDASPETAAQGLSVALESLLKQLEQHLTSSNFD